MRNNKTIYEMFPPRNSGEKWNAYEDSIIMNNSDKSDVELSFITGRSVNSIRSRRCAR